MKLAVIWQTTREFSVKHKENASLSMDSLWSEDEEQASGTSRFLPREGQTYTAHCDGASRGNPGRAGIGAVLQDPHGNVVVEVSESIGTATCNVAEYEALIAILKESVARGVTDLRVMVDSKLVCEQMMNHWKVSNPDIFALVDQAKAISSRIPRITYQHIPRELNTHADKLATTGADSVMKYFP